MTGHVDTLRDRLDALVARSDADRNAVAADFNALADELHIADKVVATARRLNEHRVWVGVAAAALILAPKMTRKLIRGANWLLPAALGVMRILRRARED
jgi:hypothetical protein